jgi:hypothetical protein
MLAIPGAYTREPFFDPSGRDGAQLPGRKVGRRVIIHCDSAAICLIRFGPRHVTKAAASPVINTAVCLRRMPCR